MATPPLAGNTTRFVHLSDPHLTQPDPEHWSRLLGKRVLGYLSWNRRRRHEHRPEVLAALQRQLQQLEADQILVTGDLTQIALPNEFIQAARWLRDLGDPAHVALVPGNHDSYVKMPWQDSFAHWLPYLQGDNALAESVTPGRANNPPDTLYPQIRIRGDVAFIGLSSAIPTAPFMATGKLGQRQLQALAGHLDATGAAGLFRVVHLHHPLSVSREKWRKRLIDTEALEALLARHGAELVLHGHRHRTIRAELSAGGRRIPVIGAASASARGDHAEAATFSRYTVSRPDESEGGGWQLSTETWRWRPKGAVFECDDVRDWSIARPASGAGRRRAG